MMYRDQTETEVDRLIKLNESTLVLLEKSAECFTKESGKKRAWRFVAITMTLVTVALCIYAHRLETRVEMMEAEALHRALRGAGQ